MKAGKYVANCNCPEQPFLSTTLINLYVCVFVVNLENCVQFVENCSGAAAAVAAVNGNAK